MTLADILYEAVKYLCMVTVLAPAMFVTGDRNFANYPGFKGESALVPIMVAALLFALAPTLAIIAYLFRLMDLGAVYTHTGSMWSRDFDGSIAFITILCCFLGTVRFFAWAPRWGRRIDKYTGVNGYKKLDDVIAFICSVGVVAATVQVMKMAFRDKDR